MNAQPQTAEDETPVLVSVNDGIATLTLNRPKQRNALSSDMMAALSDALDEMADHADVRVVILAANGPVFCAGHDLKEIRSNDSAEFYQALFSQCSAMMLRIVRLPKPVIARVHGTATAAGCQLVASCDLAIASDNALFATPGVNIGLFCSTPMVALSRNVGRKQAMEMLLTGKPVDADMALGFGLINQVVTADELDDAVNSMAKEIASKSPMTLAIGKEAFYRQLEFGISEAYDYASEVMTRNMLTHDAGEGIAAFVEKRHPVWKGE